MNISGPSNQDRAEWADAAVVAFNEAVGFNPPGTLYDPPQDVLGDLLCDLMHWADAQESEVDFAKALATARMNYEAEIEEEANNDPCGW